MRHEMDCRNLYAFIRLRLGDAISDREIARRWSMEWKSFNALRHGRRQVPRIGELEALAGLLETDPFLVFEVARGVPAQEVHFLLEVNDREKIARFLMSGAHRARAEAATHERRLHALLDRANDAIFTVDLQGTFHQVNRSFCELTGYADMELLRDGGGIGEVSPGAPESAPRKARSLYDLTVPAHLPALMEALAAVYRDGNVRGLEYAVRTRAGEDRLLDLSAARIDDEKGEPIGVQGIARDVTESRRLERELRRQHAVLATTFGAVPAACMLFGKDGTILLANPLVENVCEWSAEEVMGRNAFEVFGNPGPEGCPVTRSFMTGKFEQQVSKVVNRLGKEVYVHRTAGPILAGPDEVDKVVEILVDVTEALVAGDPRLLALWREGPAPVLRPASDREKRRFVRAPLDVPVKYESAGREREGIARNLSRPGLFILTDDAPPVGSRLQLQWTLPERPTVLRTSAVVVWRHSGDSTDPSGMGVELTDLAQHEENAISEYIVGFSRR